MSDSNLLIFGCAVLFIALAGAYVYLRERYEAHAELARERRPAPSIRGAIEDAG
jgi:hypothetical protein